MNKRSFLGYVLLCVLMLGFSSCGDEEKALSDCNQLLELTNKYVEASEAYANNPNLTNCNAFRQAGEDWIDFAEENPCGTTTDLQIEEVRDDIDSLDCTI